MASIISFTFREAVEDVEYKGRLRIISFFIQRKSYENLVNFYEFLRVFACTYKTEEKRKNWREFNYHARTRIIEALKTTVKVLNTVGD